MADSTSEADTVVLWKTILTPFSQLCVDVDNFSYDPKVTKSKYRKWLKGHHPDKKKICEEEDIFLRVYSKFFKDLPAEIIQYTSAVNSNEMLQFNQYVLRRQDLSTLKDNEWLNDKVINAYINLLVHEQNALSKSKSLHIDSYVMSSISAGRNHIWLRKTRFRDYKLIFIPIHHAGHWCLMIINVHLKEIQFVDPLTPGVITDLGKHYIKMLKQYSVRRVIRVSDDMNFIKFKESLTHHEGQLDASSCGVFVLMFTEECLVGNLTPSQRHVPYFRWYVVYRLFSCGERHSNSKRKICDIQCKIEICNFTNVRWIQCEREMCGRWVHTYCVGLKESYAGHYFCPYCSIDDNEQV